MTAGAPKASPAIPAELTDLVAQARAGNPDARLALRAITDNVRRELAERAQAATVRRDRKAEGRDLPDANAALEAEFRRIGVHHGNAYHFPAWAASTVRVHAEHTGPAWHRLRKSERLERLLAALAELPSCDTTR